MIYMGNQDFIELLNTRFGGERGIRTLDKVAPMLPFQGSDLNRSSSSPQTLASLILSILLNE